MLSYLRVSFIIASAAKMPQPSTLAVDAIIKERKKFRTTQAEHKAQGSAGTGTKDARAIENGDQEPRPAIGSASAALRELIVKEYMIFHAFE